MEIQKEQSRVKVFWRIFSRNKAAVAGLFTLGIFAFIAVFGDFIAPEWYDAQDLNRQFQPPGMRNIMGTDNLGRDILSRMIYGARTTLLVGSLSVFISMGAGIIIGSLAGFYSGRIDNALMRFIDILMALPGILIAILIVGTLGPGLVNTVIAMGISGIPGVARMIRSRVLAIREREYVDAALVSGCSTLRVITHHILPNCVATIIVQATLGLGSAALGIAGLAFIGLGVQIPYPEWGFMLSTGRRFLLNYPHMATFPGLVIMIFVLAINTVGDGLRDALDPEENY